MTEDEYERLINERKKHKNSVTNPSRYVEPTLSHEPLAKGKGKTCNTRYSIHVHSKTNRLADVEGRSCKAMLDALVSAKVLPDDSAKFIKEITQSQEKVKGDEETIITIEVAGMTEVTEEG